MIFSALTAIKAGSRGKISAITFEKCGCSLTTGGEQLEMQFEEEKKPETHYIIDVEKHRSTAEKHVHTVENTIMISHSLQLINLKKNILVRLFKKKIKFYTQKGKEWQKIKKNSFQNFIVQ